MTYKYYLIKLLIQSSEYNIQVSIVKKQFHEEEITSEVILEILTNTNYKDESFVQKLTYDEVIAGLKQIETRAIP